MAPNAREFESELKVFENEITIKVLRYPDHPVYGVTKPLIKEDKHVMIWKRRDAVNLKKLEHSPAFISAIHDYRVVH